MRCYPKLISLAVVFVFFMAFNKVQAQAEYGLRAGALYSSFKGNNRYAYPIYKEQGGYAFGAFFRKDSIVGAFGFQTELMYQKRGKLGRYKPYTDYSSYGGGYGYSPYGYGYNPYGNGYSPYGYTNYGDGIIHDKKLSNFSLPLLATYKPIKVLDIYAGPELGLLFGNELDHWFNAQIEKFTLGFTAGAMLRLGKSTKLDFRYSVDLTELDRDYCRINRYKNFSISVQQTLFRGKNKRHCFTKCVN